MVYDITDLEHCTVAFRRLFLPPAPYALEVLRPAPPDPTSLLHVGSDGRRSSRVVVEFGASLVLHTLAIDDRIGLEMGGKHVSQWCLESIITLTYPRSPLLCGPRTRPATSERRQERKCIETNRRVMLCGPGLVRRAVGF